MTMSKLEQIRALGEGEIARRYAPAATPKRAPSPKDLVTLRRVTDKPVTDKLVTDALCAVCGHAFERKRRDARYCSMACRQAAHRAKP